MRGVGLFPECSKIFYRRITSRAQLYDKRRLSNWPYLEYNVLCDFILLPNGTLAPPLQSLFKKWASFQTRVHFIRIVSPKVPEHSSAESITSVSLSSENSKSNLPSIGLLFFPPHSSTTRQIFRFVSQQNAREKEQ